MPSKSSPKVQLRRLLWVGPLTILASILGVLIVRVISVAILQPDPTPISLGWVMPIIFTFVLVTGAVLVFALVALLIVPPLRVKETPLRVEVPLVVPPLRALRVTSFAPGPAPLRGIFDCAGSSTSSQAGRTPASAR